LKPGLWGEDHETKLSLRPPQGIEDAGGEIKSPDLMPQSPQRRAPKKRSFVDGIKP